MYPKQFLVIASLFQVHVVIMSGGGGGGGGGGGYMKNFANETIL